MAASGKEKTCADPRFMGCSDLPRVKKARTFAALTLLSGLLYMVWVWYNLNFYYSFPATIFFIAEVFALFLFMTATINVWRLRFKPQEGLPPEKPFSVDVFITSAGEPLPIVKRTLKAAGELEWHWDLNLYVLDDAGSDDLEAYAKELGFHYLSRLKEAVPKENAKAGNLNFGLERSSGELILVLDADQVVESNALLRIAGYFKFDDLAFVQTQQDYFSPQGDPYYSQDEVFYGTVQKAFDDSNSAISCGSGVIYRRAALESIGGFVEWNMVEDLTTSYELHAHGWKSFYYPHPISKGLAPYDVGGVYHQRSQWALDAYRLLIWDTPLFKKGLSLRQRMDYMAIPVAYLSAAFFFPAFFLIPLWTYTTGHYVMTGNIMEFVVIRLLYFFFMALAMHYMFKGNQPGKQFQMLFGLFPVYALNFFRAFFHPKGHKPAYHITNVGGRKLSHGSLFLILPQIVLLIAHAVLPFYAIWENLAPGKYIFANAAVSSLCIWLLWQILGASLTRPRFNPSEDPDNVYA